MEKPALEKSVGGRRRAISVSTESLITTSYLQPASPLPLVIEPAVKGLNAVAWAASRRKWIEEKVVVHGGLLFRRFNTYAASDFEALIRAIAGDLLEYRERSSPRSEVGDHVYTSTDYPAEHSIFLHNENSYQHTWPLRIFFFCLTPAEQGGETPIADCRKIFARIDPQVRQRFTKKGVMYVRNFGEGMGLPWQTVFQTTDRQVVEKHCRSVGIKVEWKDNNRLRTSTVRPAVTRHPRTGEMVWFNHATFFHVTTLAPSIRKSILAEFQEEDLPTNTYYGDGTPIEPSVLDELRESYRQETVAFPWEKGDVLMLDNMLVAHGRAPFVGTRKVLVGMTDATSAGM
jgi:alpha-ketoglutarate-dependent taurine dioxygenase